MKDLAFCHQVRPLFYIKCSMLITINKLLHLFQIQENIEFKTHFFAAKCFNTEEDMTIFYWRMSDTHIYLQHLLFNERKLKAIQMTRSSVSSSWKHTKSKHYILLKERSKRFLRALFFFYHSSTSSRAFKLERFIIFYRAWRLKKYIINESS